MRGVVILALVVVLAGGGGYYYWTHMRAPAGGAPATAGGPPPGGFAMPVEAAAVEIATVERRVPATGSLRSNESVVLSPEVAGRLSQFPIQEGQRIGKGTVIAVLDTSVASAELAQARAGLNSSQSNLNRARDLASRGYGSVQRYDEAIADVQTRQSSIATAQARLDRSRILAPFDGVLGLRRVSVGEVLQAGAELVSLDQIDPIKIDFRVPETVLSNIHPDSDIEIELDALPGRKFAGKVYAIDPQIDAGSRSIQVRARLPNPDFTLRPGLFARVSVLVERRENAVLVPEEAIVPVANDKFVMKIVEGKAEMTKVSLGERRPGKVEIRQGLKAGDVVITAGLLKVRPGAPVMVLPPPGAAPPGAPAGGAAAPAKAS